MNTKALYRKLTPVCFVLMALLVYGCSALGLSSSEPADEAASPPEYYYSNFEDVPIPVQMKATSESYIVHTQGGVKLGMEAFSGRVEPVSLNKAMHDYMMRDGWSLYSFSSGPKQAVQVFVKDNMLSVIITNDGALSTEMRVYITQRL